VLIRLLEQLEFEAVAWLGMKNEEVFYRDVSSLCHLRLNVLFRLSVILQIKSGAASMITLMMCECVIIARNSVVNEDFMRTVSNFVNPEKSRSSDEQFGPETTIPVQTSMYSRNGLLARVLTYAGNPILTYILKFRQHK